MEGIILLGIPCIITALFVYLQVLVMKLSKKIWHFVPIIFFAILFLYGFLRASGMMIYYTDKSDWLGADWEWEGFFACITGVVGFWTSLITMPVIYIRRKKHGISPSGKLAKMFAGCAVGFMIAFSGYYVYTIAAFLFTETRDYRAEKLLTIGEYMFDGLENGKFDLNTSVSCQNFRSYVDKDVYSAFRYTDFSDIYFLDEHTVCIDKGTVFQSVSGYLVTDGQKTYSDGFFKIPGSGYDGEGIGITKYNGYDNLYYWSAGL